MQARAAPSLGLMGFKYYSMRDKYSWFPTKYREVKDVPKYQIFIIRIIIAGVFAVFISRFFFKNINVVTVGGLLIFFVGMAYILEHFRNKKS